MCLVRDYSCALLVASRSLVEGPLEQHATGSNMPSPNHQQQAAPSWSGRSERRAALPLCQRSRQRERLRARVHLQRCTVWTLRCLPGVTSSIRAPNFRCGSFDKKERFNQIEELGPCCTCASRRAGYRCTGSTSDPCMLMATSAEGAGLTSSE